MQLTQPSGVFASVLAYNNNPAVLRTLFCLRDQSTVPSSVLVVDNGSDPPVAEYLKDNEFVLKDHESVLRLEANRGVGAGHNTALRAAMDSDCEFAWLLEHDTFVLENCLSAMLARYQQTQDPSVLVLHPTLARNRYELELQKAGRPLHGERALPSGLGVHSLTFNGLLMPLDLVRRLGPIREDLIVGFEDLDLHRRLTACGARLETIVDAWAIHPNKGGGRYPEPQPPARSYFTARNHLWLQRESLGHVPLAAAFRSVLGVIADLASRSPEKARARLRGTLDGLRTRASEVTNEW